MGGLNLSSEWPSVSSSPGVSGVLASCFLVSGVNPSGPLPGLDLSRQRHTQDRRPSL
jgi:hypothetical protein